MPQTTIERTPEARAQFSLRALNAELLATLQGIANNRLSADVPSDERKEHDYAQGWDTLVLIARTAIAKAEGRS